MSRFVFYTSLIIVCSLNFISSSLAQTAATGALTGTIKDPSGAVIPNVTVTATNTAINQSRSATTSADGTYKFGLLPPGSYRVRFEAAGFGATEAPSVTI